MAIPCMLLFHLFFYLWYLAYLVVEHPWFPTVMVPWLYAFRNYVASISWFKFYLRRLAFRILELCCLDSMFLVSFTVFEFCIPHSGIMLPRFYVPFSFYGMCILNYGIMLPRFHDSSFIYDICILHFGIMLPRFHVPSFIYGIWNSAFPILE